MSPNIGSKARVKNGTISTHMVLEEQTTQMGVTRPIKKRNIDQQLDAMKWRLRDQTITVVKYDDACSYVVHLLIS
ncbi:hypothetical protein DPMN_099091, partial [Dreissena polymorpha]